MSSVKETEVTERKNNSGGGGPSLTPPPPGLGGTLREQDISMQDGGIHQPCQSTRVMLRPNGSPPSSQRCRSSGLSASAKRGPLPHSSNLQLSAMCGQQGPTGGARTIPTGQSTRRDRGELSEHAGGPRGHSQKRRERPRERRSRPGRRTRRRAPGETGNRRERDGAEVPPDGGDSLADAKTTPDET
ncbi:unnamed protein product [Gadus morhua 'NCC']